MDGYRKGEIFSHLLLFARRLKERGLKLTPGRVIDAVRSLQLINLSFRSDFASALKANFVSSREELALFDELFEHFWSQRPKPLPKRIDPGEEGDEDGADLKDRPLSLAMAEEASQPEKGGQEEKISSGYSPQEVLLTKDFSQFRPEETSLLEREFSRLISHLATKVSRRRKSSPKGREMDFRRTFRHAVHHGGEIVELVRRRRKIKPLKIIVICDVSGSMDASTRFILRFFFGLRKVFPKTETFVFSTRLTRITDLLQRHWGEALAAISGRVQDWSGGTQIGGCLRQFNERQVRGLAVGSAVIILISDGWDRGDSELLDAEMRKLKRRARRIIWMNPLAGTPGYQPLSLGMRTALPYVNYFLPANTLKGWKTLGDLLIKM